MCINDAVQLRGRLVFFDRHFANDAARLAFGSDARKERKGDTHEQSIASTEGTGTKRLV